MRTPASGFPGDYRIYDGNGVADDEVLLFAPGRKSREYIAANRPDQRPVRYLEMTGWAAGKGRRPWGGGRPGDASIPYSDHADFNDLLAYVESVQPPQSFYRLWLSRLSGTAAAAGLCRHPSGAKRRRRRPRLSDAAAVTKPVAVAHIANIPRRCNCSSRYSMLRLPLMALQVWHISCKLPKVSTPPSDCG